MSASKMQALIDRAGEIEAIRALIEAVKLLARGQAQTMVDISKVSSYGAEPRIGGGE